MTGAQPQTTHTRELFIGGKWEPQSGTGSIDVLSASTEEVIGSVPEGTAADVDRAVAGRSRGLRYTGAKPQFQSAPIGCASSPMR